MFEIKEMKKSQIESVVRIISNHLEVDGRLARSYYEKYFSNENRMKSPYEVSYVGLVDDDVVGMVGHCPDKYEWPGVLWLNWFYVDPRRRRCGYGSELLSYIISRATEKKARKLYLDTGSDATYEDAVRLYRNFGFVQEGILKDYYGPGDHYLIMALSL